MNSDKNKMKQLFQNGKHFAMAVVLFIMATAWANAQEPYIFMEGSIHSFSVTNNPANTFAWSMAIDPYNNIDMDPAAYDLIEGGDSSAVTMRFEDLSRSVPELVYLVVEETAPNGCSTRRALAIELQPNNMYFDFAHLPNADDCFNYEETYFAEVQVGMNFNMRGQVGDQAISEDRFPLRVKYSVENITLGIIEAVEHEVVIEYNEFNTYALEIPEAKGELDRTIEYELTIDSVVDAEGAIIKHDQNRRMQIRIMNHLPQTGGMEMVLAYSVAPVMY